MKTICTILLVIIVTFSYSQEKKDSKIIVTLADTSSIFERVVKSLYEKGYDLESKDKQLNFISTKEKPLNKYAFDLKTRIIFKENTMVITGKIAASFESMFGKTPVDVEFVGAKSSPVREAWNEMVDFGKQFGAVTYSK